MQITTILIAIIFSLHLVTTSGSGQGTVGIHAITDRYALIVDTNVLSLIVVDVLLGGIKGTLTFTTQLKTYNNIHFMGVTTCDTCLYIHVNKLHWKSPESSEDDILEIGPLDKPLLQMAKESNFTSFNNLSFETDAKSVWPFPEKYHGFKARWMKLMVSHPSGNVGFVANQKHGVLRYKLDSNGKMIEGQGDLFFKKKGEKITGLGLSSSRNFLSVAGSKNAYLIDITNAGHPEYASLDGDYEKVQEIALGKECFKGIYRNVVLWDDLSDSSSQVMYVDGRSGNSMGGKNNTVLQKLTKKEGKWGNCEIVAGGNLGSRVGWRDGCGSTVRFTRPHDMTISPGNNNLLVTDIDNRAIRLVQPSFSSNHMTCVSTISYDEGLYLKLFTNHTDDNQNKNDISKRLPYVSHSSIPAGGVTFAATESHCKLSSERENSNTCTLEEVRESLVKDNISSGFKDFLSKPFWTKESCKGCWKRYIGICTEDDPSWDNDFHMVGRVVNLDSSFPDERGLRTECLQDNETMTPDNKHVGILCCGDILNEDMNIER